MMFILGHVDNFIGFANHTKIQLPKVEIVILAFKSASKLIVPRFINLI